MPLIREDRKVDRERNRAQVGTDMGETGHKLDSWTQNPGHLLRGRNLDYWAICAPMKWVFMEPFGYHPSTYQISLWFFYHFIFLFFKNITSNKMYYSTRWHQGAAETWHFWGWDIANILFCKILFEVWKKNGKTLSDRDVQVTEVIKKSLQRAGVDKVDVRMSNFPPEISPVRPPGIEALLHAGLSLHTHYR